MKNILLLITLASIAIPARCQDDVNIQMVFVKGGNFFMGCDDKHFLGEEFDNERPVHRVNVSSYYIGKYEVTLGQWRAVMGIKPPAYDGVDYGNKDCDNCPVVKVSWEDVQEFIAKLNDKTGKHYRLPTETEWEYAARGGKYSSKFQFSGSDKLTEVGWFGHPKSTTHPVGQKLPNELSIYDMSGNAMEWCSDWYDEEYYKTAVDKIDPKGPETGTMHVLRGGSYYDDDKVCRTTYRSRFEASKRQWNVGFRLAMD